MFVYVIKFKRLTKKEGQNPTLEDVVKIGMTNSDSNPYVRIYQSHFDYSNSNIPQVIRIYYSDDSIVSDLEKTMHEFFFQYRISTKRELFNVKVLDYLYRFDEYFADVKDIYNVNDSNDALQYDNEYYETDVDLKDDPLEFENLKKNTNELTKQKSKYTNYFSIVSAIIEGNLDKVSELVVDKKTANSVNHDNYSVLSYAVCYHNIEIVKYLLKKGADTNSATNSYSWTALMEAIYNENYALSMVELLIKNGADVNVYNGDNQTVLNLVVSRNYNNENKKAIKELIENAGGKRYKDL